MNKITVNTTKRIVPMIYAYTTPEIKRHDGWTKIGYTEQDVVTRINQQLHTADVMWNLEWKGTAVFDDGTGDTFIDKDFHVYLRKRDVKQEDGLNNEWFNIDGPNSKKEFYDFKSNRGIIESDVQNVVDYNLRKEQSKAVNGTKKYYESNPNGEFLWNAKPRFGKTLSAYDFCKQIKAINVLIVTNRPAIANSWYSDYEKFVGTVDGYYFVSEIDTLKGRTQVLSRNDFLTLATNKNDAKCIEFVSLQDLKGSIYFGGAYDKLEEIKNMEWDVLIVDEAHEGVDTYKTDVAFDQIKRKFTLHLSGTPFKALANEKFREDAIYNWTYADEQKAKENWDYTQEEENPYANLPKLNLFTYKMSEIIKDEIQQGIEINGETVEYAFDLNEFFETRNGSFVHESAVDRFLDALTTLEKFPFSTEELRNELNHTFWILNRVDSAKALSKKLQRHNVFKDYEIVLAAGDGLIDDDDENIKSYDKVVKAIATHQKTITISVGQLTTGVTIPEWTGVLMLSNMKSPSLYMQAAFRAQNPCLFNNGTEYLRKENAYVFDFDPARTLIIFEEFANDLSTGTVAGRGDIETRKKNIKQLLNFFPVIGEDENGEMIELDAEKVLSIPRKIKSQEVVRRGFMSDYLFQNVSNVFRGPQEVMDIINNFTAVQNPNNKTAITKETGDEIPIADDGTITIPNEVIIGKTQDIFGNKIYGDVQENIEDIVSNSSKNDDLATMVKEAIFNGAVKETIDTAKEYYGNDMKPSDNKQIERQIKTKAEEIVNSAVGNYEIQRNIIEKERENALIEAKYSGELLSDINNKFDNLQDEKKIELQKNLQGAVSNLVENMAKDTVAIIETNKKEREKRSIEDGIKDHLRGFSRTIPSFLMAYGDDTVTLATFDQAVPDKVFTEVTSITLDQFKFLRDGGEYTDEQTGEKKHFNGQLFDSVVFDDSVKEFLRLKKKLADYFDEKAIEDIFDYIPPQKTNQIFTPKDIVKKMIDMLEEENPGCFDKPDKTFIDLYMKSGLYITEIVKRLFNSSKLKEIYPKKEDRLRHIFKKQVYGLAPTEIIYNIALNYILGFDEEIQIDEHNFRLLDSQPYTEAGTLQEKLDEIFDDGEHISCELNLEKTKSDIQEKKYSSSSKIGNDDIISKLAEYHFEYIDNREKSDIIWVLYECGRDDDMLELLKDTKYKYSLEKRGSVITSNRAAWRIMCR